MRARFWEIDFLRGIAVIMMVVFHFLFNLSFFTGFAVVVSAGFWFWFARITASIFVFLAGTALSISNARALPEKENTGKKFFLRGARIFCYGLAITAITWIFFPEEFIVFGVLHFMGVSIIIAQPFLKWKLKNLFLGAIVIIAGIFLQSLAFGFSWLLWLGFLPQNFASFDYFPLLPWFGIILFGIFAGKHLYPLGKRGFSIRELGNKIFAKQLCWIGRHSLIIYFLHQPILIAVILTARQFALF
ncbi:MAG TPA: heparan-alpha-glucosaminide N-acetyltransferase [archaeon]|nr:heparan-alpha-glucosaminide N-acetyltransferase [archaeon]